MIEDAIYRLSLRQLRRRQFAAPEELQRSEDADAYHEWRCSELRGQLHNHFDVAALKDKDILDFGCGGGALSFVLKRLGARRVIGTEINDRQLTQARQRLERSPTPGVTFHLDENPAHVALPDESFDTICCFDVVEHLRHPKAILTEWRRLLRPGGQVWIWWCPWRHPFGHHLMSVIPLPWVHLLVPERALCRVAERVYNDPTYVPRMWDLDPETGQKQPDKWRESTFSEGWLNKLSLAEFKRLARQAHFGVRVRTYGFGTARKGYRAALARLPYVGEYLTSYYAITLVKRDA